MKKLLISLLTIFSLQLFSQSYEETYERYVGYKDGSYPLTLDGLKSAILSLSDSGVVHIAYPGIDSAGLGVIPSNIHLQGWIQSQYISTLNDSVFFKKFNTVLYVSNNYTTNTSINEYQTIASALADYHPGDVIMLAPEYFNEDVTISIDSVHIQGLNKHLSKIKSLTVTGGYCWLENFTVNGIATFTSQKPNVGHWNFINNSKLENVIFLSALNLGTDVVTLTENMIIKSCGVYGGGQININLPTSSAIYLYDMDIRPSTSARSSLYLYGGSTTFEKGNALYFDSISYVNPNNYTHLFFSHCNPLRISDMSLVTSTQFHILVLDFCRLDWGDYQVAGSFTFSGLFELDIINSSPTLFKNIVFNSTGNSRIMNMQQRGWGSTSQISGTGLINLRIYNSSLSGTVPDGLGADGNNNWSAFMDN